MKSLEEIKNEVAKSLGFDPDYDAELMIDECMQEYAKQCCHEQIKACSESIPQGTELEDYILNTKNVLENYGK